MHDRINENMLKCEKIIHVLFADGGSQILSTAGNTVAACGTHTHKLMNEYIRLEHALPIKMQTKTCMDINHWLFWLTDLQLAARDSQTISATGNETVICEWDVLAPIRAHACTYVMTHEATNKTKMIMNLVFTDGGRPTASAIGSTVPFLARMRTNLWMSAYAYTYLRTTWPSLRVHLHHHRRQHRVRGITVCLQS